MYILILVVCFAWGTSELRKQR